MAQSVDNLLNVILGEPPMDHFSGETWSDLLRELARDSDDELAQTWLGPLKAERPAPDLLRIVAPTRFHAERVEKHYGERFRDLMMRQFGRDIRLEFVSAPPGNGFAASAPGASAPGAENGNGAHPPVVHRGFEPPVDEYDTALARATRPAKDEPHRIPSGLYQRYTFDHFVVGKSNQFAHAAALGVAEHPGHAYNPLFIFGGSGLGKTHVMQAIGNRVLASSPGLVVHYTSAENFMNEMIGAIQSGGMVDFRNKWRSRIDVLLVDDVHFLQGKESTQEEFFHTFNALHGGHKQIVMTSDRPPKEISTLEERLVSRFEWGLVTDIQAPDLETRIAILRKKAQQDNLSIKDDVLEFIASNVRSNIRELEGSLIRLLAFSSLTNQEINLTLAREVLKDILKHPGRIVTVETIQKIVADYHGIPEEAMKVKKRTSSLAYPRQIAMYLSRELTDLSLSEIGNRFGGRDHTTVMHACEKIVRQRDDEPDMRRLLQKLTHTITDHG
jgi:chromosomal replication initiator protein